MGLRMLRRWRTFWKQWLACFGSWDISWYSSRRSEGILGRGILLFFSRCKLLRHVEAWGMRRIQLFMPVQLAGTADRQTASITGHSHYIALFMYKLDISNQSLDTVMLVQFILCFIRHIFHSCIAIMCMYVCVHVLTDLHILLQEVPLPVTTEDG